VTVLECPGGPLVGQYTLTPDATMPFAHSIEAVRFSPDGRTVFGWAAPGGAVGQWDVASGRQLAGRVLEPESLKSLMETDPEDERPIEGFFSEDARYVVAIDQMAGQLTVWETATGRRVWSLRTPQWLTSGCFSPDGAKLAVGRMSGLLQIWEPRPGRLLHSLEGPEGASIPQAFLQKGRILVSNHADGATRLWNVATGRLIKRIDRRLIVAWSPDGKRVAVLSARDDLTIHSADGLLPEPAPDR
ncbi:MAG: PD40 domain-containing protein, partial [Pirellulales bacterium]|nr:PD40 domain-containing protein [Pirellulales bacterium]